MQCNHHTFARPSGAPQSTAQTQYGRAYRHSGVAVARLASRGNALFRNGSSKCTRTIFGVILSDMIWQPHDHWINSEEWHRRRWHILWLGIPTFLALAIFGIGVGFIPGIFSPAGEDANSLQNVHHKFWFTESAKSKPQNGKSAKTPGEV